MPLSAYDATPKQKQSGVNAIKKQHYLEFLLRKPA